MDTQDIERRAMELAKKGADMDGGAPLSGLGVLESHVFLALFDVYRMYYGRRISRETGGRLKKQVLAEAAGQEAVFEQRRAMYGQMLRRRARSELLRCQVRKKQREGAPAGEILPVALRALAVLTGEEWEEKR